MKLMLHAYGAFLPLASRDPFLFPRRCFTCGRTTRARKVIVRNHFCAFAILTLMMKRLSTLWAHLPFILRLTIIINSRLCVGLCPLNPRVLSVRCSPGPDLTSYYISFRITCEAIFAVAFQMSRADPVEQQPVQNFIRFRYRDYRSSLTINPLVKCTSAFGEFRLARAAMANNPRRTIFATRDSLWCVLFFFLFFSYAPSVNPGRARMPGRNAGMPGREQSISRTSELMRIRRRCSNFAPIFSPFFATSPRGSLDVFPRNTRKYIGKGRWRADARRPLTGIDRASDSLLPKTIPRIL